MYLIESKLKETSSTEFYCQYGSYYAVFNGIKLTLGEFFKRATNDIEIAKVLLSVQKKMKTLCYKGTILEFIKEFFCYTDSTPDVLIKNGVKDAFAVFDDKEIQQTQKVRLGRPS